MRTEPFFDTMQRFGARGVVVNMSPCHGEDHRFDPGWGRSIQKLAELPIFLCFDSKTLIVRSRLCPSEAELSEAKEDWGRRFYKKTYK